MQDYLIKKDDFKFKQILTEGYIYSNKPVILNESIKANGNIKILYAQYSSLIISIKFGNMSGADIKEYNEKFVNGEYEYWDTDTRTYKTANFIVTKGDKTMINTFDGEIYNDFDVVLTKSSEVV